MQNNNRKILDSLVSRTKIYLILIFILLVVICVLNYRFIIPAIVLFSIIIGYTYFANNKRKSELSKHLQDLTLSVNSAGKNSLIHSPYPLVIVETDGNIIWKSTKFVSEFANIDINNYISEILTDINSEIKDKKNKKDRSIKRRIQIENKFYKILGEFVKSNSNDKKKNNNKYMIILYFIDETENIKIEKELEDSKNCIGIISIDNYEETMQQIETEEKPIVLADIEKAIYDWANESEGLLIKADRDRFIYIFENRFLEEIKENKFSILDTVKEINVQGRIQITLSIAISNEGENNKEKYKSAQETMDIVLGRGGDQAAIREDGKYHFFGGKATEVERRTKVKARIVAHALEELILENSKVIVMGHINPDIDALGSALGMYRLAKSLGKEAYIAMSTDGTALKTIALELQDNSEYSEAIINKEVAENKMTDDTLLIIVDTNKSDYVEFPSLIEKTNKIAIIDHHRRSTEYIEQSILTFQEVYASSAAELVTELLQYTEVQAKLTDFEAECLYAGIMMDTKNFTFKTGVRTFEAVAYLRRCGIDAIKIKKWFQSDFETYKKITDIVKQAEIIRESIAIATYEDIDKEASVICAKAADELLTIGNISTSFVLATVGEKVNISGRSIGDVNVQLILEKMGGGGHGTLAGAQIEDKSLEEVKTDLLERIDEYFDENEN